MKTLQERLRNDFSLFCGVHWEEQEKTARKAADAIDELVEVLEEAEAYFDNRADAEYFTDSPQPVGNEEMRHLTTIRAILTKYKAGGAK
jgi:hypothetical protein